MFCWRSSEKSRMWCNGCWLHDAPRALVGIDRTTGLKELPWTDGTEDKGALMQTLFACDPLRGQAPSRMASPSPARCGRVRGRPTLPLPASVPTLNPGWALPRPTARDGRADGSRPWRWRSQRPRCAEPRIVAVPILVSFIARSPAQDAGQCECEKRMALRHHGNANGPRGETGAQFAAVWHRRIRENTAPRRRDNQGRNAPQDRAAMLPAIL